jgi:hypothetical protein
LFEREYRARQLARSSGVNAGLSFAEGGGIIPRPRMRMEIGSFDE